MYKLTENGKCCKWRILEYYIMRECCPKHHNHMLNINIYCMTIWQNTIYVYMINCVSSVLNIYNTWGWSINFKLLLTHVFMYFNVNIHGLNFICELWKCLRLYFLIQIFNLWGNMNLKLYCVDSGSNLFRGAMMI